MKRPLAKVQPVRRSSFLRKTGRLLISESGSIVIFAVLGFIGILHHEMWRDEMQAWLLAKDSPSLAALYQNTLYEGHPLLWHVCLYGLAKISHNPFIMQTFHLLLSTASFALIVTTSPFSWLQKRLFGFSYFIFYEYSVISRSYALGVLLTFLFCALYRRSEERRAKKRQSEERPDQKERPREKSLTQRLLNKEPLAKKQRLLLANSTDWILATVLVLLANVSVMGLAISFGLGVLLLFRITTENPLLVGKRSHLKEVRPPSKWLISIQQIRQSLPYAFVLIAGWALCLFQAGRVLSIDTSSLSQTLPAAASIQSSVAQSSRLIKDIINLNPAINKFSQFIDAGYFILPPLPLFSIDFWNRHLFSSLDTLPFVDFPKVRFISITVALIGVLSSIKILWRTPRYLLLYVVTTGLLTTLHLFFYTGSIRHYGHFLIVLVMCLWLSADSERTHIYRSKKQPSLALARRSFSSVFLTILLSIQAFTGVYAYTMDLIYPFSNSRETARYIQSHQLENEVIFGYDDRKVIGISGYLNRDFYFPNRDTFGSFWKGAKPQLETPESLASSVDKFAQQQSSFIAITTNPIVADLTAAELTELARFERAVRLDERFFVYRVMAR